MSGFDYDALAKAGVETVVITYAGSNDEGWVEDPEVKAPEGVGLSDELEEELRQTAYNILERNWGGWEINEGSSGNFTINVKERKTELRHGEVVESTNWHTKQV